MNYREFLPLTGLGVALALSLSACDSGSGKGLDANGQPTTQSPNVEQPSQPEPVNTPVVTASLENVQRTIFNQYCTQCHAGSSAPLGLRLDSTENSFNLLVNQSSVEVSQLLRVNPGDPDNSYLVRKLEGGPDIVGAQMPLGSDPLSSDEIDLVRQWIAEGAMP